MLSNLSITIPVVLALSMIPLSTFPLEYAVSKYETSCVYKDGIKQYAFREYVYASAMLVSQVILLGLFIHPLRIHNKTQRKSNYLKNKFDKDVKPRQDGKPYFASSSPQATAAGMNGNQSKAKSISPSKSSQENQLSSATCITSESSNGNTELKRKNR